MSKATLTMIGMYHWDSNLFKNLILPAGIDMDTEISTILLRAGEFEVLYSDFEFMEEMIGIISKKWQRTFQKWYDALQLEYNPIENYDRYETWTDTGKNTGTITGTESEKTTGSSSENIKGSSSDKSHSNSTTDTFVTPYDSDALHQDNESKSSQDANSSGETNQDTTGSNSENTNKNSSENRDLSNSSDHSGHLHGNIGVTTSQEMLTAELDIDEWNLYEHIADVFIRELCIPVY